MRTLHLASITATTLFLAGCFSQQITDSKACNGNLEINIVNKDMVENIDNVEIFIDGKPIGNLSKSRPVLYLTTDKHVIEARHTGYKTVSKEITILGEPNHQVVNILLVKP